MSWSMYFCCLCLPSSRSGVYFGRSAKAEELLKGRPVILIQDGQLRREALLRQGISPDDVAEDMRLNAQTEAQEKIKVARLEVSGDVSFILAEKTA